MPPRKSAARAESPARSPARTRTTRGASASRRVASPVRSSSKSRSSKKEEVKKSAGKKSARGKDAEEEEDVEEEAKPVAKKRAASKSRGRKDAEAEEPKKEEPAPARRRSVRRAALEEEDKVEKVEKSKVEEEAPVRPRRGRSRAAAQVEEESSSVKDVPALSVRTRSRSGVRGTKATPVNVEEVVPALPAFDIPVSPLQSAARAPSVPAQHATVTPAVCSTTANAGEISYRECMFPFSPLLLISAFFAAAATLFPLWNLYGFVVKAVLKDLAVAFRCGCIEKLALPVFRLFNPFELTFFSVLAAALAFFVLQAFKPKSADAQAAITIFARGILSCGVLIVAFVLFYYKHRDGKNSFFIPVMGLSIADLVLNFSKNAPTLNVLLVSMITTAYTFVFIPQTPLLNAFTCNVVTVVTSVYFMFVLHALTRTHVAPHPNCLHTISIYGSSIAIGLLLISIVGTPTYFIQKAYNVAFEQDKTKLISASIAALSSILSNILFFKAVSSTS